jgi:hypothetical protein
VASVSLITSDYTRHSLTHSLIYIVHLYFHPVTLTLSHTHYLYCHYSGDLGKEKDTHHDDDDGHDGDTLVDEAKKDSYDDTLVS